MNDSITVIDKNGNSIVAEGIACIQFISSGKTYILYTLNEKVENDLTKMYVGEIGINVGELDKIEDEEWSHIKTTLNGISHGEINPDLKYVDMNSLPLNIGIPKKLAIKADVKQAFSDRYHIEVMKEVQGTVPTQTETSQPSTGFFNSDVVSAEDSSNESTSDASDSSGSIFANPMMPDLTAQTVAPTDAPLNSSVDATPVIQNDISGAVMQAAPVAPVEPAAPIAPSPVMPDMNDGLTLDLNSTSEAQSQEIIQNAQPATDETSIPVPAGIAPVENQVVENISTEIMDTINNIPSSVENIEENPEPVTLEQMMPSNQVKGIGIKQVTKEEALAALEIINKYILQNGGTINVLQEDNVETTMESEEVPVPAIETVEEINEEPVMPTSEISVIPEAIASPVITPEVPQAPEMVQSMSDAIITDNVAESQNNSIPVVEPTTEFIPEAPTVQEMISTDIEPVPSPVNTPEMIPTIDINQTQRPAEENNFVSMGINDINNVVADTSNQVVGDALQVTGESNLINLDALTSIPELEPINDGPAALTEQPISNAYVNSDPSGIPVTLPNNYNNQGTSDPSSVLGPGSLPVNDN